MKMDKKSNLTDNSTPLNEPNNITATSNSQNTPCLVSSNIKSDDKSQLVENSAVNKRPRRLSAAKNSNANCVIDDETVNKKFENSKSQKKSLTPSIKHDAVSLDDSQAKFLVGDLVWAKVTGHPWWPCMISPDPLLNDFAQCKFRGNSSYNQYHVQFFGQVPERGWIKESCLIPFEGYDAFVEWCDEMIAKNKKDKARYEVRQARRPAWEFAVADIEFAVPLTREQRKDRLIFIYEDAPKNKAKNQNKKSVEAPQSQNVSQSLDKDKVLDTSIENDVDTISKSLSATSPNLKSDTSLITSDTDDMLPADFVASLTASKVAKKKPTKSEGVSKSSPEENEETFQSGPQGAIRKMHQKKPRKRKHKSSTDIEKHSKSEISPADVSLSGPPSKKRKHSTNAIDIVTPDTTNLTSPHTKDASKLANRSMAQFMVFYKKRLESVKREHPDYTEIQIEQALRNAWELLDEEQRSKFIPMGSDVKDLSEWMPNDAAENLRQGLSRTGKKVSKSLAESVDTSLKTKVEVTSSAATKQKKHRPKKSVTSNLEEEKVELESQNSQEDGLTKVNEVPTQKALNKSPEMNLEIFKLFQNGSTKKENVCEKCETTSEDLISCEGSCGQSFHAKCLNLNTVPVPPFQCEECLSGIHTCFACKGRDSDLRRCGVSQCGRHYHIECAQKFPLSRFEKNTFSCPLHSCANCAADDDLKINRATKGRMYRCIRCPTAYHTGDKCIAAGSINIAGFHIICSKHFRPKKGYNHHQHLNVGWCFLCSQGGTLLCCESCPAAFHAACLEISSPEGGYFCPDCASGKRPKYGDIVWVKVGTYRWWPGEICHPRNVPTNIQVKEHSVGEFPMHFFGSNDYFWTHQGRVFLFQEGDKGSKENTSKALDRTYQKAVKEATIAYKLWREEKDRKEVVEFEKKDKKPAPYKAVKVNYPIGNVQPVKVDLATIPRCNCDPSSESPCGPNMDCLNRMMFYECNPLVCRAGTLCRNRQLQERIYPDSVPFKVEGKGWGLKTNVDIKKGDFVNEYVGDLIDDEECRRRLKHAQENNITNFYILTVEKDRLVDAGPRGNLSRFMNHSCAPNLATQKWTVNGEVRVGIFAIEDISAGSELTFNYNLDCLGNEKTICKCGAPVCSGFLGVQPKSVAAPNGDAKPEKKRKKKKNKLHSDARKQHEDECFRCGDGGELVMCDKSHCPKSYHLSCLSLAKPPHGKWTCPWHHCDDCGKPAVKLCCLCPNSFCGACLESNVFVLTGLRIVCSDHTDLIYADANAVQATLTDSDMASAAAGTDTTCSSSDDTVSATASVPGSPRDSDFTNADNPVFASQSVQPDKALDFKPTTLKKEQVAEMPQSPEKDTSETKQPNNLTPKSSHTKVKSRKSQSGCSTWSNSREKMNSADKPKKGSSPDENRNKRGRRRKSEVSAPKTLMQEVVPPLENLDTLKDQPSESSKSITKNERVKPDTNLSARAIPPKKRGKMAELIETESNNNRDIEPKPSLDSKKTVAARAISPLVFDDDSDDYPDLVIDIP